MKKIISLFALAGIVAFSGCTTQDLIAMNTRRDTINHNAQKGSEKMLKHNEELNCLLVDDNYHAQAFCKNRNNTIRFYTTYSDILKGYNILHKMEVSNNRTNTYTYLLPNYKIAHLKIWISKK